jgi:hypothetical protein
MAAQVGKPWESHQLQMHAYNVVYCMYDREELKIVILNSIIVFEIIELHFNLHCTDLIILILTLFLSQLQYLPYSLQLLNYSTTPYQYILDAICTQYDKWRWTEYIVHCSHSCITFPRFARPPDARKIDQRIATWSFLSSDTHAFPFRTQQD